MQSSLECKLPYSLIAPDFEARLLCGPYARLTSSDFGPINKIKPNNNIEEHNKNGISKWNTLTATNAI